MNSMIRSLRLNSLRILTTTTPASTWYSARLCSQAINDGDGNNKSDQKQFEQNASRDRRIPIELETSLRYMNSDAFKETYQNYKIWELFRRNFKGQFSPAIPRISCVGDDGFLKTTNPCVICRDPYLVIHQKNIELLKHFISPQTGYVYPNSIICLCNDQYEKLCVAVELAKNYGYIDFEVPIRHYDYDYHYRYRKLNKKQ